MNNTKKVLLYGLTIVVLALIGMYEYGVRQWRLAHPDQSLVREDKYLLWALALTLISVSLFQLFRKKKK